MKISVVVATRNRDSTLEHLLKSLIHQDYPKSKTEVIVINYGGTPSTKRLVQKIGQGKFKYVYADQKGIFNESHSKNIGVKMATGEVIICTNADIIFAKDTISKFSKIYKKTKGGYLYQLKRHDMPENTDVKKLLSRLVSGTYPSSGFSLQDDSACGDFQAAKRSLWRKVRGYDELMTGWGRMDLDLVERFALLGTKQLWMDNSKVKIYHQYHPVKAPSRNTINNVLSTYKRKPAVNKTWGELKKKEIIFVAIFNRVNTAFKKSLEHTFAGRPDREVIFHYRENPERIKYRTLYYNKTKKEAVKRGASKYIEIDNPGKSLASKIENISNLLQNTDLVLDQRVTSKEHILGLRKKYPMYNIRGFDMRLTKVILNSNLKSMHYLYEYELIKISQELEIKVTKNKSTLRGNNFIKYPGVYLTEVANYNALSIYRAFIREVKGRSR